MKKIKFMLMSLAFLAVVGGALAFKASFGSTFCTGDIPLVGTCTDSGVVCPNPVGLQIDGPVIDDFVCTTDYDNANCASGPLGAPQCGEAQNVDYD